MDKVDLEKSLRQANDKIKILEKETHDISNTLSCVNREVIEKLTKVVTGKEKRIDFYNDGGELPR